MNQKQLRYSFNFVLGAASRLECKDLHHKTKHQHDSGNMCAAEYELHKHISIIKNYMKENNI